METMLERTKRELKVGDYVTFSCIGFESHKLAGPFIVVGIDIQSAWPISIQFYNNAPNLGSLKYEEIFAWWPTP